MLTPALASDSAMCVQEELAGLGYQPGPADGVLGKRSRAAAEAFNTQIGLGLPGLTKENAEQWCGEIRAFADSPDAAVLRSWAAQLLPSDVLLDFAKAVRGRHLCPSSESLSSVASIEPVSRIEGFSSRMMSDRGPDSKFVPGARDVEEFAWGFGSLAAHAMASDDGQLKGDLLEVLQKWATAGALLDTYVCAHDGPECTQWTVADGSDPSRVKDWEFAVNHASGIIRAYYIALADFQTEERDAQHAGIRAWVAAIGKMLKRAEDVPQVYFFGEVFWPDIVNDYAAGRQAAAHAKLRRLENALDRVVLAADGSIKQATNRGDRALWYQFYGLSMIVPSMEMMRAAGIPISGRAEERLHKAVALFLAALDDPDILDPWARQRRNARYDGTQDFDFDRWTDVSGGGSWLHIYPYRYPERPEAVELRKRVPADARSASTDGFFGMGLGCLYNAAADTRLRRIGMDIDPSVLAATSAERLRTAQEAYESGAYTAAFEQLNPLAHVLENADAQLMLATMYWKGQGVLKNPAEAADWYRRAGEQGVVEAQFRLGNILRGGFSGVPRDRVQAAVWFRRAAEAGHVQAQFNLGRLYRRGMGVSRDDAEALKWFRLAADGGHKGAAQAIESLEQP